MPPNQNNRRYLVAGCKPWNRRVYERVISRLPGEWQFVCSREEMSTEAVRKFDPRYVFFLHWSWIVPDELVENFACVCFHMTDVPFGRGGSPLQNLIARGIQHTKLTALRMVDKLDAGPVYMKEDLSLHGNAEEIYIRASELSAQMIGRIVAEQPEPTSQTGEVVEFKRRRPEQSRVNGLNRLEAMHDFIRMLDADGYPHAFIEQDGFRYEFHRAALYDGRISADVTITEIA